MHVVFAVVALWCRKEAADKQLVNKTVHHFTVICLVCLQGSRALVVCVNGTCVPHTCLGAYNCLKQLILTVHTSMARLATSYRTEIGCLLGPAYQCNYVFFFTRRRHISFMAFVVVLQQLLPSNKYVAGADH